ncbi:MAG TPA: isochorismatase family protein [Haliangiales bacterium]|nr:isochorismatase family protein [Haliangiales bacterium]
MSDLKIDPARAALLVIDVQQRLFGVTPEADRNACARNIHILAELARRLRLPVVWSEQYPHGLGPTIPPVADALAGLAPHRVEKLEFSLAAAPAWEAIGRELGRDQLVVVGMEAHVCVYQTVRDLCERGATVFVPADAVVSRTRENRDIGLALCAKAGGIITSTEVIVFDALGAAGTDDFRAMSKLVK